MGLKPGSTYFGEFATQNPSTGAAQNADSLPAAKMTRNGVDDNAVALTVTNLGTGRYSVTALIPTTYQGGDQVQVSVAATVNGVSGEGVIDSFILDAASATASSSSAGSGTVLTGVAGTISTVAGGPASVSGDAGSVTQQPIPDLVEADRYLAQRAARGTTRKGALFSKLIPAGPVSDQQGTGLGYSSFGNPGGVY